MQENNIYTRDQYEYRKMVPIQGIGMNTRKWYRLKNNINIGFKLFITIKKRIIITLSSRQAGKQVSDIQAELKKAGAMLTHNFRRHHVWRGYRLRYD